MRKVNITSVIINWNLKASSEHAIQSLLQSDYPTHIILVDNGSEDGSAAYLAERFPQIEVIALPANMGFGVGCNQAIQRVMQAGTDPNDFIFLLNNDAVVEPGALEALVQAAEAHPEAGILGAKVLMQEKPGYIWSAGAMMRRGVLAAKQTGIGEFDRGQFDQRQEVDYIFGAAMFLRCSMLKVIGAFDECFFLYLEDLDLCLRARQAGFTIRFAPAARVYHQGRASTENHHAFRKYHYAKSTILFLKKHLTPVTFLPGVIFWVLVLVKFILIDLAQGKFFINIYLKGMSVGLSEGNLARPSPDPSHTREGAI